MKGFVCKSMPDSFLCKIDTHDFTYITKRHLMVYNVGHRIFGHYDLCEQKCHFGTARKSSCRAPATCYITQRSATTHNPRNPMESRSGDSSTNSNDDQSVYVLVICFPRLSPCFLYVRKPLYSSSVQTFLASRHILTLQE